MDLLQYILRKILIFKLIASNSKEIERSKRSYYQILALIKQKKKDKYNYDLNIKSEKKIEIASKNTKGEATVYKININSTVEVFLDDKLLLTKHYNNSLIYSSEKKIIKMKEVESRNLSNLSSKLADEIILTLSLAK